MKPHKRHLIGLTAALALLAIALVMANPGIAQGGDAMEDDKMDDGMMNDDTKENPSPFMGIVIGAIGTLALARRLRHD